MRETTMKRNTTFSVLTLGVAMLLAGCSAQSPTAPKNPSPPKQGTPTTGLSVTLTAAPNPASVGEVVVVVAQVNSGSGNAPDNTAVTFLVSGGVFPVGVDTQGNIVTATSVVRTTSGGRTAVNVTSAVPGQVTVEARVAGGNALKTIAFQTVVGPTPTPIPGVSITSVSPNQGAPEGGDRVVISGRGFVQPLSVNFVVAGQPFLAAVNFVATDGTTMIVTTPRVVSTPPATQDQAADVVVAAGQYSDTLKGGFTFKAASLDPQIFVLTPNAGPFEGGTKVVISGVGFVYPVQVLFGTRQAQVTSSNYTEVDCIAPSITPEGPNAFTTVSVTVTNTANGKVSNGMDYRYGETMYISGIEPPVGPQDAATTVTIFGQGFVSPVAITVTGVAGVTAWDVTDVSGTEITARTRPVPSESQTSCGDIPVAVTVTNLGSNTKSPTPGQFTYQPIHPFITSVQIDGGGNTVTQYVPGTCTTTWNSHTVTIHGSGFQSGMKVTFVGDFGGSAGPVVATFIDSNTLSLTLPDLTALALRTVTCNDGAGTGQRDVATPVNVLLENLHNGCSNTLVGAIILNPCVTSCQVLAAPTVASVSPNNGSIAGGDSVIITGTNFVNSGLSATFAGASASGVSFIDATHISATTPGHTPAGPVSVTVFCGGQNGTNASAFTYTATMDMTIAGTGTVSSSPAPFVGSSPCSTGTCNWTFNQSVVQLTASTTGTFSGWSGASCGCTGTTTPCSVTMNQARACTATFTP